MIIKNASRNDIERLQRMLAYHKGKLAVYPRTPAEHAAYQHHTRVAAGVRTCLNILGVES